MRTVPLVQGDAAGEETKRGVRISQGKPMNVLKRGPSGHSQGSFRRRRSMRGGGDNAVLSSVIRIILSGASEIFTCVTLRKNIYDGSGGVHCAMTRKHGSK